MVKARLITGALLVAALVAAVSFGSGPGGNGEDLDESESWQRFSQRCAGDSLKTIDPADQDLAENESAPARLADLSSAEADFRACDRDWATPVERAPDPCDSAGETCASSILAHSEEGWISPAPSRVAGTYRVTSAAVLNPGTEGALRVIEFTATDKGESGGGAP